MRILSISIILISLFFLVTGAIAQDTELPKAGMTPDHPLYFFEIIFEEIGTFFTFGDLNKAERYAVLASERIAEAETMAEKENSEAAQNALERYEAQLNKALAQAERAKNKGESLKNVSVKVAEATEKHLAVLDKVLDKVPEEAREGIERARIASMNGQQNALKALAEEDPEKATEINLESAEAKLNRARERAEKGDTEGAEESVLEFQNQHRFGEEICQIAQGLGKDTTTVDQLVGRATSIHLEVLSEVYEKVPEQAKESIEKAIEVSVRGHEQAVESLKEKGQMDDVPEELPVSEKLPEQIKLRIQRPKVPQQ